MSRGSVRDALVRTHPTLRGPDGARLFYDGQSMRRRRAVPMPLAGMIFGRGAVHGLDGEAHRRRKALFLRLLTDDAARDIAGRAAGGWGRLTDQDEVDVFEAAVQVHADAVCGWAGIPSGRQPSWLARELMLMVDGFGSPGRPLARGWVARLRCNRWATALIEQVRSGHLSADEQTPLAAVAAHRDEHLDLLPARVAGVELLNMLRPTVAVAYPVISAAIALTDPDLRAQIAGAGDRDLESFAHEVRRVHPFVPVLAARTTRRLTIDGEPVRKGRRVLLDVVGTLHDPALFADPERFDATRFRGVHPDPYTLIPQGGGDAMTGHRCPGERVAIELIKTAARFMATHDYRIDATEPVPPDRFPSRPAYGPRLVRHVEAPIPG